MTEALGRLADREQTPRSPSGLAPAVLRRSQSRRKPAGAPLTRIALLALLALALPGCTAGASLPPAPDPLVIGGPGKGDGHFHQPRAVEALPDGSCVVIDRSGRIQRFDPAGRVALSWRLPEFAEGQPVDLTLSPWGTLLVADTHYHRVLEYDTDGNELRRIGESDGLELVRGVAVGHDGTIYAADYGEQDRIHRFDRDGRHLGTIGARGEGEGEFLRPEGLAIGEGGDLFVLDCGHHRVLRFRPDGAYVAAFGSLGAEPGHLLFPMDIAAAPDGTLYVVDFQGNRVQRFTPEGELLGGYGGAGTEPGRFATPRGVAVLATAAGHRLWIADTNNHRVQAFDWPGSPRASAAGPDASGAGGRGSGR